MIGFARGGVPEVVDARCSRLVAPEDVAALGAAIGQGPPLSRRAARERAVRHCSAERMLDQYEHLYRSLSAQRAA